MMDAKMAHQLYQKNWDKEYTTMEELLERIGVLASNGCYSACVYIDSKRVYDEVWANLHGLGFGLEDYNGGDSNIIEITW